MQYAGEDRRAAQANQDKPNQREEGRQRQDQQDGAAQEDHLTGADQGFVVDLHGDKPSDQAAGGDAAIVCRHPGGGGGCVQPAGPHQVAAAP